MYREGHAPTLMGRRARAHSLTEKQTVQSQGPIESSVCNHERRVERGSRSQESAESVAVGLGDGETRDQSAVRL